MSSLICLYLLRQSKVSGNRGTKQMMGRSLWGKGLHWGRCCTLVFFLLFGGPSVQVQKEQFFLKVHLIVKMPSKNLSFLRKSVDTPCISHFFLPSAFPAVCLSDCSILFLKSWTLTFIWNKMGPQQVPLALGDCLQEYYPGFWFQWENFRCVWFLLIRI